ncbi:protein DCL, chloroplastic-like isoform X1 [Musa acuminata AAA Group]|uniref:protein DCL, chloroplastic-like isoform X1 n=1 Tax=Musa acuminata AAA Group TaxID=214697 RepID=UPI0031CF429E
MTSISASSPPPPHLLRRSSACARPSSSFRLIPFPPLPAPLPLACVASSEGGKVKSHAADKDPTLLRRPLTSSPSPENGRDSTFDSPAEARGRNGRRKDEEWVDWEDLILQDTVPLVGFVRMILHSGKYESGDRLSPEHEKAILERLLPYHPEFEKKIGCGIDYITIGFHPDFENSRCLFIVRKDGESEDFSYWKCIKGFIMKNYPLYADTFILRHFRKRKYNE